MTGRKVGGMLKVGLVRLQPAAEAGIVDLNPHPQILSPKPEALNPKPQKTLSPHWSLTGPRTSALEGSDMSHSAFKRQRDAGFGVEGLGRFVSLGV